MVLEFAATGADVAINWLDDDAAGGHDRGSQVRI
jgi:hypothetical protein